MEFNEKLQELRKRNGLTQEELAGALFVSRTAISKWESGRGYPNIDSLRAISKYFSVTVDELLSGDELLTLAAEDSQQKQNRILTLLFGLIDCCAVLIFFLPLFGQSAEGMIRAVSLLALSEVSLWLRTAYIALTAAVTFFGILMLTLQNFHAPLWDRCKNRISLSLGIITVLLFIVSSQPYAACFIFVLLVIKALVLVKRR